MGESLRIWGTSASQINDYYIFVLISFIILLFKFRRDAFSIFIIIIYFAGLISYAGKDIFDIYKIFILAIALFWFFKTKSVKINYDVMFVYFSFLFFTFSFFYSSIINNDYYNIILSQYSRYLTIFIIFLIIYHNRDTDESRNQIRKVIYDILIVQILLSVVKLFIMGPKEGLVGSVASQGGAMAALLPIMGFMYVWVNNKGVLKRKDWIFTLFLILIGFAGLKRAIWFVMPVIIFLLIYYIPRRKIALKYISVGLIALPLLFYVGVRLNPTLNREYKIWGSFDFDYLFEYTETYSFGKESTYSSGEGRGGATFMLIENFFEGDLRDKDWFGLGLRYIHATNYEDFQKLGLNIKNKGSAAGVFQTWVANGFFGVIFYLTFIFSLLKKTRNNRLRIVLIGFFIWDYFFYVGSSFRELQISVLFLYVILFSERDYKFIPKSV